MSERLAGKGPVGSLLASVVLVAFSALATGAPAGAAAKAPRPPRPPFASTGGALHISDSTAELSGTVNARGTETSYYFQYGPTTAYGAQTPATAAGSGTTAVKVSVALSGLQLGTSYDYRLVAVSVSAGTAEGQSRTFTTKQIPLKFALPSTALVELYGSPLSLEGTLTGTGGSNHEIVLQANPFPYLGSFGDIGQPISTNAAGGFLLRVPSLAENTKLRVGTLDAVPAYSQALTLRVAARVTLRARPVGNRGLVRFDGIVRPAEIGAPVVFQLVRPGRGPVKIGTADVRRASGAFSRFSALLSIRHAGAYRALVEVTNGQQVSGSSQSVSVRPIGTPRRALRTHPRRRG